MSTWESSQPLRDLEHLGRGVARELRARRARSRASERWASLGWFMLGVPAVAIVQRLFDRETDGGWVLSAVIAGVALGVPLVATLLARVLAGRTAIDARDGLARLDHELGAEGRLQAAHEFLGAAERSTFMAAAIDDALPFLARARTHELTPAPAQQAARSSWLAPLLALALCAVIAFVPSLRRASEAAVETPVALATVPDVQRSKRERDARTGDELRVEPPALEREQKQREAGSNSKSDERAASREPEREAKESTGKTGGGRSAEATPTSSTSDSRGFQSSQSQPSQPAEQSKSPPKKPKPPKTREPDASAKKKLDQQSGSTAGKGVGSGSSKNPGSTEWESKDQVSSDEEEPLDDDQDVDDESDESEARGGLQPSLRDRRPAVNRDLTIGFGNQVNPDANGRGGPSEQKKSRGVASLVLGVPIPDHVKGQPNPGKTKITQERVEPRAENAEPLSAAPRTPRADALGRLTRRELSPWMRELVRDYFLSMAKPNENP
ncbi:MAG: hypothetical protein IT454_17740 [Planctomycetes bacterium]|nr:hypothetical protein [Planctomycetota bacterium]